MSKSSTLIELNGNQYDQITGQLIGTVQTVAQQIKLSPSDVVDSFIRPSVSTQSVHKGVQHSRTLMRHAVSKPSKIQASEVSITKNHLVGPSPKRAYRAKIVTKDQAVARFGTPLKSAPKPSAQPVKIKAVTPRPISPKRTAVAATASRPLPSMVTSVSHQKLERLLDQALATADAHKQARRAKPNWWQRLKAAPRWLSIGSSLAIVLLLGGFFIWQSIPQIAMRVAASKAQVNASMPGYTPSGFSYVAPINFTRGAVTIKFKSTTDAKHSFNLTQESSSWDSASLLSNAVPADAQVQTSQIKGTTVYIYGSKNDAAWVNHGVRYTLTDHANLNSDQILRIASSL